MAADFQKIAIGVYNNGIETYDSRGMVEKFLRCGDVKAVLNISELNCGVLVQIKVNYCNDLVYSALSIDFNNVEVKKYTKGSWENIIWS